MKAIKGIIMAVIVIIVIAVIAFLTLNKKSLDANNVVSKTTNSSVAQGVANTPADSSNIVSPKEKTTTAKEGNITDKTKTNEPTSSTQSSKDSNHLENNKTTTPTATEHKQNNNVTENSNIANNTNINTDNKAKNAIPSSTTNVPVSANKTTKNSINTNTINIKPNNNTSNVNNDKASKSNIANNEVNNSTNTQNLQSYYLNQLTGITEQINAMSTKNDNDAQLLQNYGTQCNLWNGELNKIMSKLSSTLPASEASNLQNEEFQWIQNRNTDVQNTSNGGGSIAPILGAQKEAQLTKERCYYLVNNYM